MMNDEERPHRQHRQLVNRQTFRPPVVRKPSKMAVLIHGLFLFMEKLSWQLSKTLAATAFASLADYIRKKSDSETSSLLNKHGAMHDPNAKTENQRNLYGNSYPTENRGTHNGYYGSGYDQRRPNGSDSFPGF